MTDEATPTSRRIINIYNGRFLDRGQGGGSRFVWNLVREQATAGYETLTLCAGVPSATPVRLDDGESHPLVLPVGRSDAWPVFMFRVARHLALYRNSYRGAILHVHRPYFTWLRLLVPQSTIVLTVHTKTFSGLRRRRWIGRCLESSAIVMERILLKLTHRLTFVSTDLTRLYHLRHQVPVDRARLLPPVLVSDDVEKFDHARLSRPTRASPPLRFACVGRLAPVKRPGRVLELWRQWCADDPDQSDGAQLLFVGRGELSAWLAEQVRNEQGHVALVGELHADDMPELYATLDGLMLLSEHEGSPYAVREALLAGTPVFATAVGDIPRLLGRDGGAMVASDGTVNDWLVAWKSFVRDLPYDRNALRAHIGNVNTADQATFRAGLLWAYD